MILRATTCVALCVVLACASQPASPSETSETSSESGSTSESGTTGATETGPLPDLAPLDCDPIGQDCPEGQKCVGTSLAGETWDANKCVPVLGDLPPGAACQWDGLIAATDDCDADSMCWAGVCVPFCSGSASDPTCPTSHVCTIAYAGVIAYCQPTCDPLVQDCAEGEGCFWVGDQFACMSAAVCDPPGQPCSFIADCCATQICVEAGLAPSCAATFCCADLCDLDAPTCPPGSECVAFFAGGAPPSYEDVGLCLAL